MTSPHYDAVTGSGPITREKAQAAVDGVREHGGIKPYVRASGLSRDTVRNRLRRAAEWGLDGNAPGATPEGFAITENSGQFDADGNLIRQTVRTKREPGPDFEMPDGFKLAKGTYQVGPDGRIERYWPRITPEDGATLANERMGEVIAGLPVWDRVSTENVAPLNQLANLYTLSDVHIGMLAWAPEAGSDWDMKIAQAMLVRAFDAMLRQSPKAGHGIVCLLGDWLHYDGLLSVTPTSHNILDADSRPHKMIDAAIEVACFLVSRALETHAKVTLLIAEGNHDLMGTVWLRKMFRRLYADEDRLEVIDEPFPYYAFRHGETFLGFHHGHLRGVKKPAELINIYSHEFAEIWGQTRKRYIHTGDKHFTYEDGSHGTVIRQHPTLASRDAWAARMGFLNLRGALSLTYHARYGETGSTRVCPEMLEGDA